MLSLVSFPMRDFANNRLALASHLLANRSSTPRVRSPCLLVHGCDVEHTVCIKCKTNQYLCLPLLCTLNAGHSELAQQVIRVHTRTLTFEHTYIECLLVGLRRRVRAFLDTWNCGVAGDNDRVVF